MLILLIKDTIHFEGFFLIWLRFRDIEFERFSEILAIWEGYIDRREPLTTLVLFSLFRIEFIGNSHGNHARKSRKRKYLGNG